MEVHLYQEILLGLADLRFWEPQAVGLEPQRGTVLLGVHLRLYQEVVEAHQELRLEMV